MSIFCIIIVICIRNINYQFLLGFLFSEKSYGIYRLFRACEEKYYFPDSSLYTQFFFYFTIQFLVEFDCKAQKLSFIANFRLNPSLKWIFHCRDRCKFSRVSHKYRFQHEINNFSIGGRMISVLLGMQNTVENNTWLIVSTVILRVKARRSLSTKVIGCACSECCGFCNRNLSNMREIYWNVFVVYARDSEPVNRING